VELTQALLDACTTQDLLADIAKVPDGTGTKPYAVIWPDGPVRTPSSMANGHGELTTVYVCHVLGLTADSVFIAEKKLAAAVASLYRQVIDGQQVKFPVQDWAQPLARDDDTTPALYDLAVEWRLRTTPA
jgi:hypothetical protein